MLGLLRAAASAGKSRPAVKQVKEPLDSWGKGFITGSVGCIWRASSSKTTSVIDCQYGGEEVVYELFDGALG